MLFCFHVSTVSFLISSMLFTETIIFTESIMLVIEMMPQMRDTIYVIMY